MDGSEQPTDRIHQRGLGMLSLKGLMDLFASLIFLSVILFVPAGGLDWPMAWVLIGVVLACMTLNMVVLLQKNPAALDERVRLESFRVESGAKKWDLLVICIFAFSTLATFVVAGLDYRYGRLVDHPFWLPALAVTGAIVGDLLFLWAMTVNPFCSKVVRIQKERDHQVISTGPYRYVRHPGYVGWFLMWSAPPLILGSVWAFVPTGLSLGLIILRTYLEDRTLVEELNSYKDYAVSVPYRLIPGIW